MEKSPSGSRFGRGALQKGGDNIGGLSGNGLFCWCVLVFLTDAVVDGLWMLLWVRAASCTLGAVLPAAGRALRAPPARRDPWGRVLQAPVPAMSSQHRSPGSSSSGTPCAGGSAGTPLALSRGADRSSRCSAVAGSPASHAAVRTSHHSSHPGASGAG